MKKKSTDTFVKIIRHILYLIDQTNRDVLKVYVILIDISYRYATLH